MNQALAELERIRAVFQKKVDDIDGVIKMLSWPPELPMTEGLGEPNEVGKKPWGTNVGVIRNTILALPRTFTKVELVAALKETSFSLSADNLNNQLFRLEKQGEIRKVSSPGLPVQFKRIKLRK